jgi:hypothetical protein
MPFSLHPHMSPIDVCVILDSALPATWIGFAALGATAIVTTVGIACVLFTNIRKGANISVVD